MARKVSFLKGQFLRKGDKRRKKKETGKGKGNHQILHLYRVHLVNVPAPQGRQLSRGGDPFAHSRPGMFLPPRRPLCSAGMTTDGFLKEDKLNQEATPRSVGMRGSLSINTPHRVTGKQSARRKWTATRQLHPSSRHRARRPERPRAGAVGGGGGARGSEAER